VGDPPSAVSKRARKKQRYKNVKNPPPQFEKNLQAFIEKERLDGAPVGTQLEHLNKVIADQFRKPFNPPLQYWSPMMRVDMLWLGMHEKMLRSYATPSDLYQEYMHQAEKIGPDGFAEWEERFVCTYPMRVPLSLANLNKIIEEMHSELHARKRKEKYEAINAACKKRNKNSKQIFRSLGGKSLASSLDRIEFGGVIYSDPTEIHGLVTNHFKAWFSNEGKTEPPKDLYSQLDTEDEFMAHFEHLAIPREMGKVFYKAVTATLSPKRDGVENELRALEDGITLEEFQKEIHLSPKGRSGGPSGLTYDMLRRTPPSVVQHIHMQLQELWKDKDTPEWLKRKWLCAIPKEVDSSDLNKLRPIMLIEILRKLWTGAMIRKIRHAWEKYNVLSDTQYGFRSGRSCPQAILQLINAMEAHTEGQNLYMSSWDIKRAFDSIPRTIIELALRRLGVPTIIATYLAYIDQEDRIQVRTPASHKHGDNARFSSQQGAGQGDKASPSIWIAVMDIILTALEIAAPGDFVLESSDGSQYIANDLSYADDLITLSSTSEAIQRKADVVSAMTMFLGLEVAVEKFRTCALTKNPSPPPLIVHTKNWTRNEVSFQQDGFLKYLGSKQSLDGSSTEDQKSLLAYLKETATRLRTNTASTASNRLYIHGAVNPKVAYAGTFVTANLEQMQKMDVPMTGLIKQVSHLPQSWPTETIYHRLGLNMHRSSDSMQLGKVRQITRPTVRATARSVDSLMDRHMKKQKSYMTERWQTAAQDDPDSWLGSMLEYLAEAGHSLTLPFDMETNILDLHITELSPQWIQDPSLPIERIGDVVDAINGIRFIIPSTRLIQAGQPLSAALWRMQDVPGLTHPDGRNTIQDLPLYIRKGQFWLHQDPQDRLTKMVQVTGWTETEVLAFDIKLGARSSMYRNGKQARVTRGERIRLSWDDFLELNRKAIVSEQDTMEIRYITRVSPSRRPHRQPLPSPLPDTVTRDTLVCTDGSHALSYCGPCPHQRKHVAAAGIALVNRDKTLVAAVRVGTYDQSDGRAFTQELQGVIVGGYLAQLQGIVSTPVFTDCKSLLAAKVAPPKQSNYAQHVAILSHSTGPKIQWIRSHADTRWSHEFQSAPQFGNIMADQIADGRIPNAAHPTPVIQLHGGRTIMEMARRQQRWMVQDEEHGLAMLDLRDKVSDVRFKKYLKQRSEDHNGQWTYEGIQMLVKPGLTMRQIGARYKLCFSRFDRDRKAREHLADNAKEPPTPCTCGCVNHLESWIKVCTEPKTIDRIKLARVRIATLLRNERPLEAVIAPLLAGPDQMFLWRANWQADHMLALAECYQARTMTDQQWRAAQKALRAVTEELIAASLDLHGLRKEKATEWVGGVKYNPRESNKIRKERDETDRAFLEQFHKVTEFFEHADPTQTPSNPTLHPTPAPFRRPHNLQIPRRQTLLAPLPEDIRFEAEVLVTPSPSGAATGLPVAGSLPCYLIPPARMVGSRRRKAQKPAPARRLAVQAPARPTEEEIRAHIAYLANMTNMSNGGNIQLENRRQREPGSPKLARRIRSVNDESSAQARRSERSARPP
jgi:hypothetical protein